MSERTGIEWTDHTFNIAWGCFKVSPGCANCYADTLSHRYGHDVWGPAKTTPRRTFGAKHWAEPAKWAEKARLEGIRKRVFCSSMCDVFEEHPTIDAEREKLWPIIRDTADALDWQLLTKRPERIAANLPDDWGVGYPNVWLGTSVESEDYSDRADLLCAVPARVHFVSAEPLLAPLTFSSYALDNLEWLIIGGESQPGCRPMALEWARDLINECRTWHALPAPIPIFVKQLGGHPNARAHEKAIIDGRRWVENPRYFEERRVLRASDVGGGE